MAEHLGDVERTYSLREVADHHLPDEWTDGVRWLRRRLNSGELQGVYFGRPGGRGSWRMRARDVQFMLDKYATTAKDRPDEAATPQPESAHSLIDGLSERSRKRLRRVQ
jgi:hypothetical protein